MCSVNMHYKALAFYANGALTEGNLLRPGGRIAGALPCLLPHGVDFQHQQQTHNRHVVALGSNSELFDEACVRGLHSRHMPVDQSQVSTTDA